MILENFCVIRENSNLPKTNPSKQQCKVDFFLFLSGTENENLVNCFAFRMMDCEFGVIKCYKIKLAHKICSKLTTKTLVQERLQNNIANWRCLLSLLLTLNPFSAFFKSAFCWLGVGYCLAEFNFLSPIKLWLNFFSLYFSKPNKMS